MNDRPLPNILAKIKETKEREIRELKKAASFEKLLDMAENENKTSPPRDFFEAVTQKKSKQINLIAEVKKASPSKGIIREDFNPAHIVTEYERGGADAISCLTDREYFKGDLSYIRVVKENCCLPVLRKDFLINPVQIAEARANGADAVLLIARMLSVKELEELLSLCRELKLSALCEIHDMPDLEKTLNCNARLIGINNRDLDTFMVDKNLCIKLRNEIPEDCYVVAESGISTPEDMTLLAEHNMCAALVGESLMRQDNIHEATENLLSKVR